MLRIVGDKWSEITVGSNIAALYYQQGQLPQALAQLRESIELAEQLNHPDLEILRQTEATWVLELN
jgi:hypothetical protein